MFKFIGGAVLCGFAIYGLVKYLERPVVKVVNTPERPAKPEAVSELDESVVSSDNAVDGEAAIEEPTPATT